MSGASIEAILTLDASGFVNTLGTAKTSVETFSKTVGSKSRDLNSFSDAINVLMRNVDDVNASLVRFTGVAKESESFNKFANGVKALATAVETLGANTENSTVGLARVKEIIESWGNALNGIEVKIKGVSNALREIGGSSTQADSTLKEVQNDLMGLQRGVQPLARIREQADLMKAEFQQSRAELMRFAQYGVNAFNQVDARSDALKTQIASMNAEFERSKAELLEFARYGRSQFGTITAPVKQYTEALEVALPTTRQLTTANIELARSEQQVSGASEQEAVSVEKDSVAKDKDTASTKRLDNANKTLGRSLSMLRSMFTLVGSMIAYNFVHHLAMATTETINAKSEMEGYFQMLGYGKNDINEFNKALDETVKKFPRLNKYALGETISSIGVEFELSTKEMKKAMPVVSMITSEYLRAGRNVNEASLAVKDILQGEFQRLSRETGVKGKQLEEAGWSGDKNDVMGLLEALDKVGKSRNWDKFVAKANSLNDAVLITQNRFGEWSADMVNRIQPTILKVFNDIMVVATSFSKVINGAMDWLSGDGIAQGIVKWGGLALAIGNVVSGLIAYRTGANLVQVVQMGLTRSIGATILGLEAETVAEHGLTTSIIANITSTEAETVAKNGRLATITASMLGLEAVAVAEVGLLNSIGATITGIELETFANMGLAESLVAVSVALAPVIIALSVLAVAIGSQVMAINNAIDKHNKFINILDHGEEMVSEYKDTVDSLTAKKEKLEEKLSTLTEGTYKYQMAQDKLRATTEDLDIATQNYNDTVNASAWVRHKQELYDESKQHSQLQTQKEINQALIDYGVNVKEANQIASPIWQDAIDGWDQQYETLQKVNLQQKKNSQTVLYYLDELKEKKIDPKEVQIIIKPLVKSGNDIADAKEKLGNATGMMEYIDAWLWLQYREIQHSINEFWVNVEIDWGKAIGGLLKGFAHGIDDMGIGSFLVDFSLWEKFDEWITEQLNNFNKTDVTKWFSGIDWNGMLSEALERTFSFITGIDFDLLGHIFDLIMPKGVSASDGSSDHPSFMDDLSDILGFDVQQWINNFQSDPLGTLGIGSVNFDVGSFLSNLFMPNNEGIYQWVQDNIITPLIDGIKQGVENTPILGDVASLLGFCDDSETESQESGQTVGTGFTTGVQTGLAPLDGVINQAFEGLNLDTITSNFTSNTATMTSNATSTATSVGASFVAMKNNHKSSVDSMVSNNTTAFRDMHDKSTTQMLAMRDSTSQTTKQMTDAWGVMRDGILASARKIQDESSKRFGDLGSVIGGFYKKIQNPSLWGSGSVSVRSHSPTPASRRVGRAVFGHGAGGSSTYSGSRTMSIGALKSKLCPNGDCGSIFDGYNYSDVVDVREFLASITGEHGFGWNFDSTHNQYIKNKSNEWDMKSPIINLAGGISTNTPFKVREFDGGKTPHISFDKFQAIAGSIFSAIPYKHYMDSSWKGSWLGALMSGACNCSDGADALIALARTFGFSAYKQWGTWGNEGHFWAVINGVPMDTTAWQGGYGWTSPKVHGYGSANLHASSGDNKTVNVTVDMQGATIYGVDDLDSRIQDSVQKGLQAEFNDPYTVSI